MSNYYNAASATVGVTVAKISVTKPSLAATTVYTTGSAVGPTIKNYNSTYMTQSGITSTSTLGTYKLTWTLKDTSKYQWSDGTTGAYSINWTCAGGTISITWTWTWSAGNSNGWNTSYITYKNKWSDYSTGSGYTKIAGPCQPSGKGLDYLYVNSTGELITCYYYRTGSYWKDTQAGNGPTNNGKYGGREYVGTW